MTSTYKFALAASAAIAFASPALAQDHDPATDFDGFYIGGSVGLSVNNNSGPQTVVFDTDRNGTYDNTVVTTGGANAFAPGFCTGGATGPTRETACTGKDDDLEYAIRLGLDKRMGSNLVIGGLIEAGKSNATEGVSAFSSAGQSYSLSRGLDWNVAARARLGIVPGGGGGLFYVTGGATYGRIRHSFATTDTANTFATYNDKDMAWGWQAGGGAEVMLGHNLSLGLEYLYNRYSDKDHYVGVTPGGTSPTNPFRLTSAGTNMRMADTRFDYHSLRATVGFHF